MVKETEICCSLAFMPMLVEEITSFYYLETVLNFDHKVNQSLLHLKIKVLYRRGSSTSRYSFLEILSTFVVMVVSISDSRIYN